MWLIKLYVNENILTFFVLFFFHSSENFGRQIDLCRFLCVPPFLWGVYVVSVHDKNEDEYNLSHTC